MTPHEQHKLALAEASRAAIHAQTKIYALMADAETSETEKVNIGRLAVHLSALILQLGDPLNSVAPMLK